MSRHPSKQGFTLVELLITIVIIGILVGIGYPTYQDYVMKARRSDGQTAVLDLAARMERYYAENNSYASATLTNLGLSTTTSPEGYYNLTITSTATTFTATAAPTSAQVSDTACASLTYNQLGQKSITGTSSVSECW